MAVPLFVALRNEFADYRERMLDCLKDPSPEVRFQALTVFQTFLSRKDISSLLHFQHDNYLAETEMGSPLVYALRNQALAVIESLCGKEFRKTEKVVMLVSEERIAYCWDWQPFLNWWKKEGSKWRFWRQ